MIAGSLPPLYKLGVYYAILPLRSQIYCSGLHGLGEASWLANPVRQEVADLNFEILPQGLLAIYFGQMRGVVALLL
jgi:hypothetical protein